MKWRTSLIALALVAAAAGCASDPYYYGSNYYHGTYYDSYGNRYYDRHPPVALGYYSDRPRYWHRYDD